MAITITRYNSFSTDQANGVFNFSSDTIGIILATALYLPDRDAHSKRSDITNEVVAGGGYAQNDKELAAVAITQDDVNDLTKLDANNVTWSASTITARYAILYRKTGGASSTDNLICYVDFGVELSSVGENFTVEWNSDGIINWTD